MAHDLPLFTLYFEVLFLESFSHLKPVEQKAIEKAVQLLANNPRHPSLKVHKAKNVKGKYPIGGPDVYIGYVSSGLRVTFEYGPEPGMIALRNCGHHDVTERKI